MADYLPVGTVRNGMEIVSAEWDHNGTLTVVIACPYARTQKSDDAARRLARRAISHPELTRKSPLVRVSTIVDDAYRIHLTFKVSRLER